MKKNIRNICIAVGICFCFAVAGIIYLASLQGFDSAWEDFKTGFQEGYEHTSQGLISCPFEHLHQGIPDKSTPAVIAPETE